MDRRQQKSALDEKSLSALVALFYGRVRADPDLGPIFNEAIDDWPLHLERIAAFWHSAMLGSGRYKGNPLAAHLKHRGRIAPEHFDRWLALWNAAATETMTPDAAAALKAKAERIAESLKLALFFNPGPQGGEKK